MAETRRGQRGGVSRIKRLSRRRPHISLRRRKTQKPLSYVAKQHARNIVAYMSAKPMHLTRPELSRKSPLVPTFIRLVREFAESQPEQEEHEDFTRAMAGLKRALDNKDVDKIFRYLNRISEIYGYTKYELAHFYLEDAARESRAESEEVDRMAALIKSIRL